MESRTDRVKRGIIWGILCKCVNVLTPFVTRTIMIYRLGVEYVGLNTLFTSLLSVLSLAELGVGSALVFSMYKPIAESDVDKVDALLAFYRRCYFVIGAIILLLGLSLLPILPILVSSDVPEDISLRRLFLIYLCNSVVGYFFFAYRSSLLTADQRVDVINTVELITSLAACLLQSCILLFTKNYYSYAVTIPLITCANNLIKFLVSKKRYPQYQCRGKLTDEELRMIRRKVSGLVFYKVGDIVLFSVDALVISSFLGLRVLGVYNGYHYVVSGLFNFIAVIYAVLVPSVGNSALVNDKEKLYLNFRKFHFLYVWILAWWSACLLSLYQPFIMLWQGAENMLPDSTVVLFVIYFFVFRMGDMCGLHREALGMWWEGKFIPLIAAIMNLCLNIILVQKIGLPGIVISTFVSIALVYIPYGGWVLFNGFFHSRRKYLSYLSHQLYYFCMQSVVSGMTWVVCRIVHAAGVKELILKGLICAVVPNLLLVLINIKNPDFNRSVCFIREHVLRRGQGRSER